MLSVSPLPLALCLAIANGLKQIRHIHLRGSFLLLVLAFGRVVLLLLFILALLLFLLGWRWRGQQRKSFAQFLDRRLLWFLCVFQCDRLITQMLDRLVHGLPGFAHALGCHEHAVRCILCCLDGPLILRFGCG